MLERSIFYPSFYWFASEWSSKTLLLAFRWGKRMLSKNFPWIQTSLILEIWINFGKTNKLEYILGRRLITCSRLLPKKIFWEPFRLLKWKVRSPSHISRSPLIINFINVSNFWHTTQGALYWFINKLQI